MKQMFKIYLTMRNLNSDMEQNQEESKEKYLEIPSVLKP